MKEPLANAASRYRIVVWRSLRCPCLHLGWSCDFGVAFVPMCAMLVSSALAVSARSLRSARFLPDSYIEKQTMGRFSVRIQRRQKTVSHMRFDDQALLPTLLASACRIAMLLRDSMATMYESGKKRADLGRTCADVGAWGAATRNRACAVLARGVRWSAPAPTPSYRISHGDRIPHPFAHHGDANAWADLFVGGASPCG